jgi:hypothetical protein
MPSEPDDDYAFARKVGAKYDADLKAHNQPGALPSRSQALRGPPSSLS